MRRRFEKRIYIPLPDVVARERMFRLGVGSAPNELNDDDYKFLAENTKGYSGHDISMVVRDALMQPVRKVQAATHFKMVVQIKQQKEKEVYSSLLLAPCDASDPHGSPMTWESVPPERLFEPVLEQMDIVRSLWMTKPSVSAEELIQLELFKEQYGQDGC
ncbi:VPS-4 protein [Aphelenchoides avenae]|nr:VPS-4 protein [Aphelenchus avenae]